MTWLNAIITNEQVCAALASAIDPEPNGVLTWNTATKVYPTGTTFTRATSFPFTVTASQEPVGRLISTPVTELGESLCVEFLSAGPWPNLNARGLSDAAITAAKTYVVAEVGDYQGHIAQFITSNGYVIP